MSVFGPLSRKAAFRSRPKVPFAERVIVAGGIRLEATPESSSGSPIGAKPYRTRQVIETVPQINGVFSLKLECGHKIMRQVGGLTGAMCYECRGTVIGAGGQWPTREWSRAHPDEWADNGWNLHERTDSRGWSNAERLVGLTNPDQDPDEVILGPVTSGQRSGAPMIARSNAAFSDPEEPDTADTQST